MNNCLHALHLLHVVARLSQLGEHGDQQLSDVFDRLRAVLIQDLLSLNLALELSLFRLQSIYRFGAT